MTTATDPAEVIARAHARQRLRAAPATARMVREQTGLTQRDVANVLGVSQATVARWEGGSRTPRGALALSYFALLRRASGAD